MHARDTEREYVENAIRGGLKILGFSDHTPYPFCNGYISPSKMLPSQLEDYVDTVLSLRQEYRGEIEIHLGLETEYYPALWEDFLRMLEPYPIEYMIMGQHFNLNEYEGLVYNGYPSHGEEDLVQYCSQCMEGLETGKFLYLAHPDLLYYEGEASVYEQEMTALCRFCREHGIPLELNLLGVRDHRHYPNEAFWRIASREGNTVIYGSDAHRAKDVFTPEDIRRADLFLEKCGIPQERLLHTLPLQEFLR